ncbi:MAG: winged helix-turn-helix transcriptional regulator [Syntrophomonadaceae bacterium]|jgi:DNA-binding transcriptional ArsR family regulator|nr:winged helix-turn-helix transcriptional regulator [Syntrophomonadaceae bacterium]
MSAKPGEYDRCEINCIHEEAVAEVSKQMLSDNEARSLADIFKTLGDSTRVKMLFALMTRELCVCDLATVIGSSESAVSHQLRILRTQKLVKFRRDGKVLYYSLDDDHVSTLFRQGLEHISHSEEWAAQFLNQI